LKLQVIAFYAFDAVAPGDSVLKRPQNLNLAQRMARATYLGPDEKK
jgi:hypothetical protein